MLWLISTILFSLYFQVAIAFFRLISRFWASFAANVTGANHVRWHFFHFLIIFFFILSHRFGRFYFISFDGWSINTLNRYWKYFRLVHYFMSLFSFTHWRKKLICFRGWMIFGSCEMIFAIIHSSLFKMKNKARATVYQFLHWKIIHRYETISTHDTQNIRIISSINVELREYSI